MRKLILSCCAFSLLLGSSFSYAAETAATATAASEKAYAQSSKAPASKSGADPVSKTAKGADYSAGAGNKAATVDMGLSVVSGALSALALAEKLFMNGEQTLVTQGMSWMASQLSVYPVWMDNWWFPVFISVDPVGIMITLGHAAVNKYMRDATNITATFTGAEGFVTDKWVGPHPRNTTVAIMGDVGVTSQKFDALAFDPSDYKDLKNADKASARELMDYRSQQLIQDQRSLSNVADAQWSLLYRAQQRAIKGLAGALQLKSQLVALGELDGKISADYKNKPSALNSVASRRALYDALLLLKMNVMAARTKLRSETLELDFKPMTKEPDTVVENVPAGPPLSPTGLQ